MSQLSILRSWVAAQGGTVEAATFAKLQILLGGRNVTEFEGEHEPLSDHLEIPLYYLAEWMAENWWPLLWEPRKSEDSAADADFHGRHTLLAAQHGFVLPQLEVLSNGDDVGISAVPRSVDIPLGRVRIVVAPPHRERPSAHRRR